VREKETLRRVKRPHHTEAICLRDVCIHNVEIGRVGVGIVILYTFPNLLLGQEVEIKAVYKKRGL
jgi:hypothetical protein